MHGVHPAPNAMPTSAEPRYPTGFCSTCTRRSWLKNPTLITPRQTSPNKMMSTPPIRWSQSW